ncbi:multidrug ABC transporter ATP-binding protein [Allostella vacuolata]|nr:multidrug ABC transporter ATP-binding protein [Stella vacuolata]
MFRGFAALVDPFRDYGRSPPHRSPWPFLRDHLKPFRRVVAASLGLAVVGALFEVWLIAYASTLVDLLAAAQPATFLVEHGWQLALVAALVLIVRPLVHGVREALDDLAFRPNAEAQVRWRSHRHVLGQPVAWFRRDLSGRIASEVRDIGASAAGAAYAVIHTLSFVTVYVIGSIVFVASIDVRLAMPLLAWLAAYLGLMAYVIPRLRRASERHQGAFAAMTGMLVDSYANIDVIKLFARAEDEDREAKEGLSRTRDALVAVQALEVTINTVMMVLGSLLLVGLTGTAILLWQAGDAPVGLVAAALALSFRITGLAEWLLDAVSSLFAHAGALRHSLATVAEPHALTDAPGARDLEIASGAIAFEAVGFRYGRQAGGLADISLSIAPGEKIGLVGPSGAGKSTLVHLLLRFFDPEQGTIRIDGQDIARVTQDSLRRQIGMVAQDATLLNRSVRDNIAYGRRDIDDGAIETSARRAKADGFIAALVDGEGRRGYDAQVGERGVQLSGGQRQRIALARAFLKDAPILVLDEATSALDSQVEADIQDALYRMMDGKTVIAIAHRLSTLARMDRLVVIDEGRIVEIGSHDTLLRAGGLYAALWERQTGGYIR